MTTTVRRKASSVLLGFFYGGSIVNGVEHGVGLFLPVSHGLADWPTLAPLTRLCASVLAAFLAGYSAQSIAPGLLACASVLPAFFLPWSKLTIPVSLLAAIAGVGVSAVAARRPLPEADLSHGRLFGVSWKHWLWLWLPWQLIVAQGVWLTWPTRGFSMEPAHTPIATGVLRFPIAVGVVCWIVSQGLSSLRVDAPYSRLGSALRFAGWTVLCPPLMRYLLYR